MTIKSTNIDLPLQPPLIIADVIARFSNAHGWISYSKFNEWMKKRGVSVTQLERHNRTDGEVHFRYRHKVSGQTFEFNGNYWSGESFGKVVEWLNQNGL
jgi:hypothetical protein